MLDSEFDVLTGLATRSCLTPSAWVSSRALCMFTDTSPYWPLLSFHVPLDSHRPDGRSWVSMGPTSSGCPSITFYACPALTP